jgi:hypothetical protein
VPLRKPAWSELPGALRGSIFLLSLVLAASMMPVQKLPDASWRVALGLGFISAVFDNIPLTALALKQGGYDWGYIAFAVGFGGSMIWFGSSAGVALTNQYPDAKSVFAWLRGGWHVALAYVVGFALMLAVHGWSPDPPHRAAATTSALATPCIEAGRDGVDARKSVSTVVGSGPHGDPDRADSVAARVRLASVCRA